MEREAETRREAEPSAEAQAGGGCGVSHSVATTVSLSQGSQGLVMGVTLGRVLKVVLVPCGRGSGGDKGCEAGKCVLHPGDQPALLVGCL